MGVVPSVALFIVGLALVLVFSEQLVESTVGTAGGFGVSAFLIGVVFIGFDPENLFVGAAGSFGEAPGIALGTVLGSGMVAIGLAFGLTALIVPLRFERIPRKILLVPVAAIGLFGALCIDGRLSRVDGALLLAGYGCAMGFLAQQDRARTNVSPTESVSSLMEEETAEWGRWWTLARLFVSLAAIVVGSEILVSASETLIPALGLTDTTFGMSLLAFLVSVEELARELPAALKGRPDITFGNVLGSVLAFFLFNAGVIALVRPVPVADPVLHFFLPVAAGTVVFISVVLLRGRVSRWAGAVLVLFYAVFVLGGYIPLPGLSA
jgi:cation:H+ antiporter